MNPRLAADYNARYGLVFDLSVRTDDKEYRTSLVYQSFTENEMVEV